MKILITGGAGFIGSHLAYMHRQRGDQVCIFDDLSTGTMDNVDFLRAQTGAIEFVQGNIIQDRRLTDLVQWSDRVYHMAAVVGMFRVLKEPIEVTRVNVIGTQRVLEAAADAIKPPQIVIPSSSSVYGAADYDQLHEEAPIVSVPHAPLLNYALSKFTNEVQGRAFFQQYQLPVVMARLFNTIGTRQQGLYGFVVPRFVQQAMKNEPITVFGKGDQTRSFCDVRDTCAMLDALAQTPEAYGEVVNVGNTQEITILDLALKVKKLCHSSSDIEFVPYEKAYGQSFAQIPQRRPILNKMQGLTGYRHRWTLDETIAQLRDYYQNLHRTSVGDHAAIQGRRYEHTSLA